MAGLPRALIKKYGVSKKAWSIFRASKGNKTTGAKTMARKRFSRRAFKRYARSGMNTGTTMGSLLLPFLYGAVRPTIANAVQPLTSKLPFGNYADEVGMGLLGFVASKWGSGAVKNAGKTMLQIESYRVGEATVAPMISGMTSTGNSNSNYYV